MTDKKQKALEYAYNLVMNQMENLLHKEMEDFFSGKVSTVSTLEVENRIKMAEDIKNTFLKEAGIRSDREGHIETPKKDNPLKEKFKKAGEKHLNMTFEEMQERRLKRTLDEIESTSKRIEDRLSCEEAKSKLPYFVIEQEDLMKEKGIKFERVYKNGNIVGWKVETEEIEIKPNISIDTKEIIDDFKNYLINYQSNTSLYNIARIVSDEDLGEKLKKYNELLNKTGSSMVITEDMWDEIFNMTKEERKNIGATQSMKSQAQRDRDFLAAKARLDAIPFNHSEFKDDSKKQGVKESDGKLDYELDWNFIEQMAQRMAQNKGKYEPFNWQKPMDIEKLKQSLLRHTIEIMKGNYADEGREFGHFESAALNSMMINYQLTNPQTKYKQEDFSNK